MMGPEGAYTLMGKEDGWQAVDTNSVTSGEKANANGPEKAASNGAEKL